MWQKETAKREKLSKNLLNGNRTREAYAALLSLALLP
jgi:hypothetical protein